MKTKFLMMILAVALVATGGFVSCTPETGTDEPTLTAISSDEMEFPAVGGRQTFTFSTNQDASKVSYQVDYGDGESGWIRVSKMGAAVLQITADEQPATGSVARSATVTISIGTSVSITVKVSQAAKSEGIDGFGRITAKLRDNVLDASFKTSYIRDFSSDRTLKVDMHFDTALPAVAEFDIEFDEEYLNAYNDLNNASVLLFPKEAVSNAKAKGLTIAAGQTSKTGIEIDVDFDLSDLAFGKSYLIPLVVKPVSSNLKTNELSHMNYVVTRSAQKGSVKNVIYFEMGRTNPLNAMEFKLDNGENFFDAVILFSSNVDWNDNTSMLEYNHNTPISAVLQDYETYLRPLQDQGIKVYLSVLPNHTAAGLTNLTDQGVEMLSTLLANEVFKYKLDGMAYDEEYANYAAKDPYLTASGGNRESASKLMKETKKKMYALFGEDKDIILFQYASLGGTFSSFPDATDGYKVPGDYIDLILPNYGGTGNPAGEGTTVANCAYFAKECYLGGGSATEASGRSARTGGYGWGMWFAWDPTPGAWLAEGGDRGTVSWTQDWTMAAQVTRGMYPGRYLKAATHYWMKNIGGENGSEEARVNPTRFDHTPEQIAMQVELTPAAE